MSQPFVTQNLLFEPNLECCGDYFFFFFRKLKIFQFFSWLWILFFTWFHSSSRWLPRKTYFFFKKNTKFIIFFDKNFQKLTWTLATTVKLSRNCWWVGVCKYGGCFFCFKIFIWTKKKKTETITNLQKKQ